MPDRSCRPWGAPPAAWLPFLAAAAAAAALGAGPSAAALPAALPASLDRNGDGREDILEAWAAGAAGWQSLQAVMTADGEQAQDKMGQWPAGIEPPDSGPLAAGRVRLLRFGGGGFPASAARRAAAAGGCLRALHQMTRFGGVEVLEADEAGLRALLAERDGARLLLDRDGRPALDRGRALCAVAPARSGPWQLEGDWTAAVAILDSGCDTAHDDLGDYSRDNIDGPPPAVGDALDWSSAALGWPVFLQYKAVGWRDVTDDFPLAAGPWDYHHHGTALAGVVAGAGEVDQNLRGLASSGRLVIVKFYDFDGVWRQWAGDFLAACDWVLQQREVMRIRVALCAVNWAIDAGIGAAMTAFAEAGIMPVAAMGNEGLTGGAPGYPASLATVLTAGAVDDQGMLAAYSSRGRFGDGKPDLLAPGGGLTPAEGRITTTDNEPNDTYSPRWGTSLAAAHLAGGALLVLEGMRKEGYPPPRDAGDLRVLAALLSASAAPVAGAATPAGGVLPLLDTGGRPDSLRGWGLLQVAAAAEALLSPLPAGETALDSLSGAGGRQVLARRLAMLPGRVCRLEAIPDRDLDVVLEAFDLRRLLDPAAGLPAVRADAGGPGATEGLSFAMPAGELAFVAVKRLAGTGRVTLRAIDVTGGADGAATALLSGTLTGWPNAGALAADGAVSLVMSGLADVDPQARLVHALDPRGRPRAGWPVALFPGSNLSGPLTAPIVWDLDGQPGAEVVVGSAYGKAYFISGAGAVQAVDVAAAGVALTAPMGRQTADGGHEVIFISQPGTLVRLTAGGVLAGTTALGASGPLAPAAGELDGTAGEEIVAVCADGTVVAVGDGGQFLPGWPLQLPGGGLLPPVLADLDQDGRHEIIVAQAALAATDRIIFHVFGGDGQRVPPDGAIAQAAGGGRWLSLSWPAVQRCHPPEPPRLVLQGLHATGNRPDSLVWRLSAVTLEASGSVAIEEQPSLLIQGLTPNGTLQARWTRLAAPLVWEHRRGRGPEPQFYAALGWQEIVPGNPNLLGAAAGWWGGASGGSLAAARQAMWHGGPSAASVPAAGVVLLAAPAAGGPPVRCVVQGRRVALQPGGECADAASWWSSARGDARNSGALPLGRETPTAVADPGPAAAADRVLLIEPNPAAGALRIAWRAAAGEQRTIDIYDLRGRRVRRLKVAETGSEGACAWDGRDEAGRPVAAGAYLVLLRHAQETLRGRAVITR